MPNTIASQTAVRQEINEGREEAARNSHPTALRLVAAARALFTDRGYDNVTVADIAAAGDVTSRTFFRHFPTKVDVLFHESGPSTADFIRRLYLQPPGKSVTEALADTIDEHSDVWPLTDDDLTMYRIVRQTPSLQEALRGYEASFEELLGDWIAQRHDRSPDDPDVRTLASILVAARRVVVDEWQESGGSADLTFLARNALRFVDPTALDADL